MNPTQELTHEHAIVNQALKILAHLCDRVETGAPPNTAHIAQLLEFITEFVDRCHHAKEEELLFPAMEQAGGAQIKPMVAQMLAEHDTGRSFGRKLKQAFADYAAGQAHALPALVDNARRYIRILEPHIVKEDTILYVVAEQVLAQAQQTALTAGFAKIEAERAGPGKHEEFHQLIHQLAKVYVK